MKPNKWGVVGIYNGQRQMVKSLTEEQADAFLAKKAEEYKEKGVSVKLYKISLRDPIYPDESIPKKKNPKHGRPWYWCPYCGAYRQFVAGTNYPVCPICGISEKDYYVNKFNHLGR